MLRWIITIAYAGFIFYLSVMPSYQPPLFPYSDKAFHAGMCCILAFLIFWSIHGTRKDGWLRLGIISVVMTVLYGIVIEFCQLFIPARSAEVSDALSNAAGAIVGACMYAGLVKLRSRRAMG